MTTLRNLLTALIIPVLFGVSLFLFTWGVGSLEVIGFESRFYMFALEMWRNGISWFPTTYGDLYPDYLGTSTWLICISGLLLGGMSKLAAVLPTAIAASLTVVLTYMIGALRFKRFGYYAVLFLLMTVMFVKSGRSIALDIYPALVTTACFYLIYSADVLDKREREWWIYPLMLLGFAFRGPIGLIIPVGVICLYYLLTRNFKHLFFTAAFSLLLLIVSCFMMLQLANHVGGDTFVKEVLTMQVIGRMEDSHISYLYYFKNSLTDYALSFPLAALASIGIVYYKFRLHQQPKDLKLLVVLLGWCAVVLLGMSIPGDKKERYILSIAPALSLMAAYFFVSKYSERFFYRVQWIMIRVFIFFPAILFVFLRMVLSYATKNAQSFGINYLLMTQILFISLAINLILFICLEKKQEWRDTGILTIAAFCFMACYIGVVEPVQQFTDRTREFVTAMEASRLDAQAQLVFYHENRDGLPIKYLINARSDAAPQFAYTDQALMSVRAPSYFVTSKSYFDAMPADVQSHFKLVSSDLIGHVQVVVFTQK